MSAVAPRLLMTADAVGGVWTHAIDLAATLGVPVTLAVLGPGLDARRRAEAAAVPGLDLIETGLPLDWLAGSEGEVIAAGHAVAALAAQAGATLVQLNTPALAAVAFPCPVVGVCHSCVASWWDVVRGGALPADLAWRAALLSRGYAGCDALVAPSHAFAATTARLYGLPHPPLVVHNGRAAGQSASGAAAFAFTAGRLWDEGKGAATLDRAAARIAIPVLAAGPTQGPTGGQAMLPHLGLLGSIDTPTLRGWLARGPIFVSTARYEPFGLSVLEAAQAGCALVLSDIATFREIWDGAALFVQPGDDAGFATAICVLSRNREQRSTLGVAAATRARCFTVEAMAAGMGAVHAGVLRAACAGRSAAA